MVATQTNLNTYLYIIDKQIRIRYYGSGVIHQTHASVSPEALCTASAFLSDRGGFDSGWYVIMY